MLQINAEESQQYIFTKVSIKNINFNLNSKMEQKKFNRYTWHFICIANIGCSVMFSTIIIDAENGILKCAQDFNFPKNTDCDIHIRLYAMPVYNKTVRIDLYLILFLYVLDFNCF